MKLMPVDSTGLLTFDGLEAVRWKVTLESTVPASRIRVKNIAPGQLYTFIFQQDATGGHGFEWPGNVRNPSAVNRKPRSLSVLNFIGSTGGELIANIPGTN